MDVFKVLRMFQDTTLLPWTGPDALTGRTDDPLRAQEASIRSLVESARQSGFKNIPPLRVRIGCKIEDRRVKSRGPVATPNDHSFTIN
jgi:hypothetical protein